MQDFLVCEQKGWDREWWVGANSIEKSLMNGCGLSHKSAEYGFKDCWVNFECQNPREQGIWYI